MPWLGVCARAAFQQPEQRRMSACARPRVTQRKILVLFSEVLFFLCPCCFFALDIKKSAPPL